MLQNNINIDICTKSQKIVGLFHECV